MFSVWLLFHDIVVLECGKKRLNMNYVNKTTFLSFICSPFNRCITNSVIFPFPFYMFCLKWTSQASPSMWYYSWDIHSHKTNQQHYTDIYHIFCCNMFVFACPIIARSQCWLFALKYPYFPPNSTSGIWAWYGSLGLIPWPIWKMSCNNLLILFKVE